MRFQTPAAAALAALIVLAPALAAPALASSTAPTATSPSAAVVAAPPKVVIVVGAVQGSTSSYRAKGDEAYAEAIKYTPNVIKIYSPNATWAKVKAAAQGASVFIYLGHGYGFPSPYREILSPSVQDGMGINGKGGVNDKDLKYYGETSIANDIRLAKNAVVILSGLCYAAGSSERGDPPPSIPVARERVDNFASGWIKAGARVVIADSWMGSVVSTIQAIFTTDESFAQVWTGPVDDHWGGYQSDGKPFIPVRNPQYDGRIDPDSDFHRSFVGAMDLRTTDVIAGASAASTVGASANPPELWSVDGPRNLTPNFNGATDRLNLLARYSETVIWKAEIKNADGDVVRTQTGSGHQAAITWDLKVDDALAPDGEYTWNLSAHDAAGNHAANETGQFTIASQPTPGTGVLSFGPTTPTMIKSGTIKYALKFASPVTSVNAGDITRTGSAKGCKVGAPVGSGADYTITVTGCKTGTVGLYLNAGLVVDADQHWGPAGPIVAAKVTIDTSLPKAVAPKPSLRTGLRLETASTAQHLLMRITWSGTDTGSGVASYDVQRSYNGGAYQTIANATTATSLDWSMTPGHGYKFRVRARDKAGNVGKWTTAYTWHPSLVQQTSSSVKYTGTWSAGSSTQYSGGTIKFASAAGASASMKFSGRAVAFVTTLRSTGGRAQVWIDGALAATIDTHADIAASRQVVFSKAWSSYGSHTIKIIVVGTDGRPRVDLDAFEVIH
jgi:hypothetical protein